ncbi:hypothetical protein KO465_04725 [Candidatus Micrarchaeota archaeon]|nr:hypothetical protein [Candidatus Micrarchaeota archaeon]
MIMIEDNSSDSTARRCPRSKESGAPSLYIEWTYGGDETVTSTPFVCSLSLDQSDVICTDLKSVTAPSPPGPSWIENNRGAGPWDFNPSPRKVIYNEGSYLANKDNPVWSPVESVLLNDPISDKHFPCGYWFKDYTVNHCLDSLCTCDGVSISGNTSMYTNGAQTLSVVNPKDGCIYVWGIESGLCELYSDIGTTVVLKAAALASTVVIGLYTQGNLCDTITISVVSPGCEDVSIGYTTLSMGGGEEQTLTAENFVSGYNYTWELTGVGSIDTTTGTSIVYTSPYTNSGCDNPTITLSIEGQVCDSITIAVNVYVEPYPAYIETDTGINEECWEAPPDRYYCGRFLDRKSHECDSSLIETVQSYGVSANPYAANCEDCFTWLDNAGYTEEYIISLAIADGHPPGDIEDLRTGYMIESGCCPVELI